MSIYPVLQAYLRTEKKETNEEERSKLERIFNLTQSKTKQPAKQQQSSKFFCL